LYFCQSPVIFSSAATASVGWAPLLSQYCARSLSIWMTEGSSVGWYLPISSMARPSRLVRESDLDGHGGGHSTSSGEHGETEHGSLGVPDAPV
jgi:hypothetical protein